MTRTASAAASRPQRSPLFIAVALAVATGAIALATFDYAVVAMQADLRFSAEDGNAAMLVPATASLVVVFVAGVVGDRLGRRRVMLASGAVFALGAAIVAVAPSLPVVMAGQVLEGAGGAAMAITALAVLSTAFPGGRARAVAFGAFAAIMPAVFIAGPVVGAALEEATSWRAIPLLSLSIGVLAILAAALLLPADRPRGSGEVITPILAGVALCGIAGTAGAVIVAPGRTAVALAVIGLGAVIGLVVAMRRVSTPSLDLGLLRAPGGSTALLALALANAVNLLFFTTLLLQYLLRLDPFEAALAMIPVQVAATAGGFAGGWVIARIGVVGAAVATLSATAAAALAVVMAGPDSPLWVILLLAAIYAFTGLASAAPLSQRVMDLAPEDREGVASAYRTAAAALGAAVGGVAAAAIAFSTFQVAFSRGLEESGFSAARADAIATSVRESASLSGLHRKALGVPLREVPEVERREAPRLDSAEISAYRAVAIAAAVANGLAVLVMLPSLRLRRRRAPDAG